MCGPAFSNSLQCGLCVNLTKLLLKRPTNFLAFSSQSYLLPYVSLGSKTFLLTFGSSVGISKSKYGITFVGALSISPFKILSIIPRVSLIEIRLPVPFQPVETKYALAPTFYIFFNNSSAYFTGCKLKNGPPKQAENVGVGSVIPLSVPASLAVKPERK